MQRNMLMILISFIFAIVLCGASAAAVNDTANETQDSIGCTADPIINGTVTINEYGHIRPLQGATVTVNTTASNSRILGTATTDENGYYSIGFYSTDTTFRVTSSYIGCDNITRTVNVNPGPDYPTDPNYYGTANIEMTPKTATLTGTGNGRNVYIQGQDKTGFAGVINVRVDGNTYQAYCIDLFTPINIGDVLLVNGPLPGTAGDLPSEVDWGKVTYIINNYNPSSSNNEAAAIQCAIWYFTSLHYGPYGGPNPIPGYYQFMTAPNDGRRDGPSGSTVVRDRAWEIINAAISMQYPYSITLTPETVKIPNGGQVNLTATVQDQNGNPLQGITVQFRKDKGTLSQNSGITDANGQVSVRLSNIPNGSTAVVTAYVTGNYGNLLYDDQYSTPRKQNLVARNLLPLILSSISIINTDATANVELTQTANSPVNVGDIINYIVTATNHGPSTATGIMIEDIIPAGLSNVTVTPSLGTYYNGVWVIPSLANSAAATLTINGTVTSAIAGTDITNTATRIAQDQYNSLSNTTSATAHVKKADVAITQTVNGASSATVNVGDTVTYLVTANNNGPDAATGLKITDLMPEGLSNIVYSASARLYDLGNGLWNIGTLINGASATLNITGTVTSAWAGLNITNYANRTAQTEYNSLSNTTNTTVYTKLANVALSQTGNYSKNIVTFVVTAKNNGPDTATNINIRNLIPTGLTGWIVTPSVGTYDSVTGIWNIGSLLNGTFATLNITGNATPQSTINNTATKLNQTEYDPNNPDSTIMGVYVPSVDIQITHVPWYYNADTKTYQYMYVFANTPEYSVAINNAGPDDATGVVIEYLIGKGIIYEGCSSDWGTVTYNNGKLTYNIGYIPSGGRAILKVFVRINNTGNQTPELTNIARLIHVDQNDTNSANNNASVALEVPSSADIGVTQTQETFTQDNQLYVKYTITVTQYGPDNSYGVQIRDTLPSGVVWISDNSGGSYNHNTSGTGAGIWNIGTFNYGDAPKTLEIIAKVIGTGTIKNTASKYRQQNANLTNQFDYNRLNNAQTTYITISGNYTKNVDIQITHIPWYYNADTKTYQYMYVNTNTPEYSVAITNAGPDDATGVIIEYLIGSGLIYEGYSADWGTLTYSNGKLTYNIGYIPSGGRAILKVFVRINNTGNQTPELTNIARLIHVDQNDTNSANNNASVALEVPSSADIGVTQTQETFTQDNQLYVKYTITVTQYGPDNSYGVQIRDTLPSGVVWISDNSGGSYNHNTSGTGAGIWNIGTFNYGDAPKTLEIIAKVIGTGTIKNTASKYRQQNADLTNQFDYNRLNNAQTTYIIP